MKTLFGTKEFYKKVGIIAIPIVLQQFIIASVNLVDNLMVGQLGEPSINAVTIVNQLNFVVMIVTFGVMGGAGIFTAQFFGAKKQEELKMSYRYKMAAAVLFSSTAFLLFILFGQTMIGWFASKSETISLGMDYLNIVQFGVFPFIISLAITTTFRETGTTKPLLYISLFALIMNAAINYVLIFGYLGFEPMGVRGAAIGTVIARYIEMGLLYLLMIVKKAPFYAKLFTIFSIPKSLTKKISLKALPLTINEVFWSVGQTMFIFAFSLRGETALAAMNVNNAVSQIVFVTFSGIATAVAVMVGNTLGENKLEEAESNAYKLMMVAFLSAVVVGSLLFIMAPFVVGLYDISDQTYEWALITTRYNSVLIWLYSVNVAIYFTLRSGGDMRSTVYADAGFTWVIMVPIALILAYFTNLDVTWLFLLVKGTELLKFFYALGLIKKKRWLQNLTNETII
ncbi:MAG: MATE family efflux transporter [Acholeplasmataceae bacterium]